MASSVVHTHTVCSPKGKQPLMHRGALHLHHGALRLLQVDKSATSRGKVLDGDPALLLDEGRYRL